MTTQDVQARWERAKVRLVNEMRQCVERGNPAKVNLSVPKHAVIALSLWEMAHDQALSGKTLPIVFSDGSVPALFPLGALIKRKTPEGSPLFARVGLMSFRHPELDYLVDLYVCRNLELAKSASMAAEEALSFERTVATFDVKDIEEGGIVEVFHTGLEPMVAGFYRGVVEVLRRRRARSLPKPLIFRPLVYPTKGDTTALTPASPGAQRDNYVALPDWH